MGFGRQVAVECVRFLVVLLVGGVLLFFALLVMDLIGWIVGGGWNEDLGSWPVFGSTISVLLFGNKITSAVLIVAFGLLCRMVSGPVMPGMFGSSQPDEE